MVIDYEIHRPVQEIKCPIGKPQPTPVVRGFGVAAPKAGSKRPTTAVFTNESPAVGSSCGFRGFVLLMYIDYRRLSMNVEREQAEVWATWFGALGEPTRIMILNCLATAKKPLTVGEIVDQLDVGQSTVSHHLAILADTCFVLAEPVGNSRLYRVNDRCLVTFPATAEVVMGQAPASAPWEADDRPQVRRRRRRPQGGNSEIRKEK